MSTKNPSCRYRMCRLECTWCARSWSAIADRAQFATREFWAPRLLRGARRRCTGLALTVLAQLAILARGRAVATVLPVIAHIDAFANVRAIIEELFLANTFVLRGGFTERVSRTLLLARTAVFVCVRNYALLIALDGSCGACTRSCHADRALCLTGRAAAAVFRCVRYKARSAVNLARIVAFAVSFSARGLAGALSTCRPAMVVVRRDTSVTAHDLSWTAADAFGVRADLICATSYAGASAAKVRTINDDRRRKRPAMLRIRRARARAVIAWRTN